MKFESNNFSSLRRVKIEFDTAEPVTLVFKLKNSKDEQFEYEQIAKKDKADSEALRQEYHDFICARLTCIEGDLYQDNEPVTLKKIKAREVLNPILDMVYAAYTEMLSTGRVIEPKKEESSSALNN
jgi:hypothetical protein